jgi:hypothetical protein
VREAQLPNARVEGLPGLRQSDVWERHCEKH